MLVGKKHGINHLCGIWTVAGGPAAVVIAVLLIYIPVESVLLGHMLRLGNVLRECGVGPSMGADQLIIPVTDPNFRHSRFQKGRLSIHGIRDGIIVFVVQKVVVRAC